MSKHADQVESLATKGDSHQGAHTHSFQQEAQSLLGGMATHLNHAAQDVQHIDFTDPFKKAGSAISHTAETAWNDLDKDKNGHFFKHDICNDNPALAGVAGAAVLGTAVVATIIAAPEALAAAGIGETAAAITSYTGVFAAGVLKFDYDRRHPNQ
jgi:hypothetical protein